MARDDEIAPTVFDGDDILVLLDRLRADGFAIGVREYITAQEIAAAFLEEDSLDPTQLRNWLAPVLCTSADQQRIFYQRFAAWWLETVPEPTAEEAPPPVVETEIDEDVRRIRPWKWRAVTALALVLVVPAIMFVVWLLEPEPSPQPKPDPVPIVDPDNYGCDRLTAESRRRGNDESGAVARQVAVPNLVGLALPDARRELASARLTAGRVIENVNESIEKGQVLRTNPKRGAAADECSEVNLYVSTGPLQANLSINGSVVDDQSTPVQRALVVLDRALAIELDENAGKKSHQGEQIRQDIPGNAFRNIPRDYPDLPWRMAFSPDNRNLAIGSQDGAVRLVEIDSDEPPTLLGNHDSQVWSVAFSADGRVLASSGEDGRFRLWDTVAYRLLADPVPDGGSGGALSLAFAPDGRTLAVGAVDGRVRLWEIGTGLSPTVRLVEVSDPAHPGQVWAVAFAPDGRTVASGSEDGSVFLWDLDSDQAPLNLGDIGERVWSLAFSPDGQWLATGGQGSILLFNVVTGEVSATVSQNDGAAMSVAFSPDSQTLASSSPDGLVRLWDMQTGYAATLQRGGDLGIWSIAFSPDGSRYASTSSGIGISDITWSGSDGTFALNIAPLRGASMTATHPDFVRPEAVGIPEGAGEMVARVELEPLPEDWIRELTVHRPEVRAGLFTIPLILTFGWWLSKRYQRRVILERREVRGARSLAAVKIPEPPHGLFRDPTSVRARIEARRRLRLGEGDLDAEATVDETIRKLGWFTPVYRSRLVLPSYLALIDRSSFRDQQARLIDEFLDRLVEGGVHVDRYYFNRDPRICAAAADDRINQRSLRELAARYSDSILVLCSNGIGLTDPLTGRLDKWTELLEAWASRSLMTPVPPFHWSSRELEIAGSGFSIWPASSAGMLTFTEQMQNPDAQVVIPADWRPSFPEIIAAHPARWLERNEPDPDDVDRALRQVRAYLGRDGYRWLCSLAVYPELDWYLTLYLGLELKRNDGAPILTEEALLSLVRLPWLRHGRIPDWLRGRLVAALSREDEQAVRGFLWNLLRARLEAPDSRFKLDIARPQTHKTDRNWKRFFENILRTEPDDSPLHDMVFVGFLLDKRPRRLQLLAPQSWRRLVYEKGIRMLGPRESVGWLIGILFAVGLAALYSPALEALRNIQTSKGESKIIEESWTPSGASSAPFSCWWMENRAPYNYVPSPFPADTEEQCFQLNSCGPGGGQSGGGCYKWAQCATCPATDWSTPGGPEGTPAQPIIEDSYVARVQTAWSTDIAAFCQGEINGRYPFSPGASSDVSLVAFRDFFQPGGKLDSFFREYLADVVDTSGTNWRIRPEFSEEISLSAASLRLLQQADDIRRAYFYEASEDFGFEFGLRPYRVDNRAVRVDLQIDDQVMTYAHGPTFQQSFSWPGASQDGARISIDRLPTEDKEASKDGYGGRQPVSFTESGPWAWQRLLDRADIQPAGSSRDFFVRWAFDAVWVVYELQTQKGLDWKTALAGFRCPASL